MFQKFISTHLIYKRGIQHNQSLYTFNFCNTNSDKKKEIKRNFSPPLIVTKRDDHYFNLMRFHDKHSYWECLLFIQSNLLQSHPHRLRMHSYTTSSLLSCFCSLSSLFLSSLSFPHKTLYRPTTSNMPPPILQQINQPRQVS